MRASHIGDIQTVIRHVAKKSTFFLDPNLALNQIKITISLPRKFFTTKQNTYKRETEGGRTNPLSNETSARNNTNTKHPYRKYWPTDKNTDSNNFRPKKQTCCRKTRTTLDHKLTCSYKVKNKQR